MDIKTRRIILSGPVFTVLYGIYIYLLLSLISNLFNGSNNNIILPLTLIISLIYLIATLLERFYPNPVTKPLAIFSEIFKGTSIYLILFTIAIYIAGWILATIQTNIPQEIIIILLFVVVPLIAIYAIYNADKIRIKDMELEFENLENPLNFIHISDVHIGAIRRDRLLNNIVKEINELHDNNKDNSPIDFVVITGDLADGSSPITEDSFKPLAKSKVPIYFTPGNHDFYPGISNVLKATNSANITTICNEMVDIKGTQLIGIPFGSFGFVESTIKKTISDVSDDVSMSDDVSVSNDNVNSNYNSDNSEYTNQNSFIKENYGSMGSNNDEDLNYFEDNIEQYYTGFDFEKIDKTKTSILLNHIPVAWDLFKDRNVDLVLSGHTHGGQFFPFDVIVKRAYPYLRGLYEDNGKYLFVSDGIGTHTPPMRLRTTAEMAVFHLKGK